MALSNAPFATFLIIGRTLSTNTIVITRHVCASTDKATTTTATCFFLGILFASFPYDYNVLWTTPPASIDSSILDSREPYYQLLENHLRFIHASPPLISRILHIVIGTGMLGFLLKLYKPSEANMLFDGASLVLYMCGIVVYITNIVKGLRVVTDGSYGKVDLINGESGVNTGLPTAQSELIGREDSLKVLAASNTILALVLVGVLVLQAGQWYAQKKETAEIEEMDRQRDEKRRAQGEKAGHGSHKKKQ